MSGTDVKVRPAKKEDMPEVFTLIKELAVFEKAVAKVKINAKTLEKDGFETKQPLFSCFVAEIINTKKVVGYAIYYPYYSTWEGKSLFLQDLYVHPSHRSQGIGKKLFMRVADIANTMGTRLDLHVLSWNPAIKFYESLGAENLTNTEHWHLYRLNKHALTELFKDDEKFLMN